MRLYFRFFALDYSHGKEDKGWRLSTDNNAESIVGLHFYHQII
ncbi:hypothetical protein HMPREF1619_02568 [Klebsiella pneumoniae 909957]|nr:hypothetical protein HMPREF1619_02568 [Klebsiella pneumoniae 909957]